MARASEFFTENPNLIFFFFWGGTGGDGEGGLMEEYTNRPKPFAPSTSSKLGA